MPAQVKSRAARLRRPEQRVSRQGSGGAIGNVGWPWLCHTSAFCDAVCWRRNLSSMLSASLQVA